jgi:hypothetical protein
MILPRTGKQKNESGSRQRGRSVREVLVNGRCNISVAANAGIAFEFGKYYVDVHTLNASRRSGVATASWNGGSGMNYPLTSLGLVTAFQRNGAQCVRNRRLEMCYSDLLTASAARGRLTAVSPVTVSDDMGRRGHGRREEERAAEMKEKRGQAGQRLDDGDSRSKLRRPSCASSRPRQLSTTEVRKIQQALDDKGFKSGRVDGSWGPETEAALKDFQRWAMLSPTGEVDPISITVLGLNVADQTLISWGLGCRDMQHIGRGENGNASPCAPLAP